jgi:hypothetical protein
MMEVALSCVRVVCFVAVPILFAVGLSLPYASTADGTLGFYRSCMRNHGPCTTNALELCAAHATRIGTAKAFGALTILCAAVAVAATIARVVRQQSRATPGLVTTLCAVTDACALVGAGAAVCLYTESMCRDVPALAEDPHAALGVGTMLMVGGFIAAVCGTAAGAVADTLAGRK